MKDESLVKNDNFRLIFVSQSVLIPEILKKTFEVIIVDDAKINEEEEFLKLSKKANDKTQ